MLHDGTVNKRKALAARATAVGAIGLAAAAGLAAFAGPARAADGPDTAGAVYTMTNSASGNAIEAFARASDGTLTPPAPTPPAVTAGRWTARTRSSCPATAACW